MAAFPTLGTLLTDLSLIVQTINLGIDFLKNMTPLMLFPKLSRDLGESWAVSTGVHNSDQFLKLSDHLERTRSFSKFTLSHVDEWYNNAPIV